MIEIPNYKIEGVLGVGGMSTVYLATHEILDRQVALKVMSPSFMQDGTFKECFINEGRIISKLNNPHVIHIYDIGISNDACYMAIEVLEGDTLREKIDNKVLSIQDIQKIISQIGSALNTAHMQNFIHRDIKPGNILFRKNQDAVLTDFGISKIQDTDGELTTLGFTAGTPSYMPPEFSMGEELDHRADIYSLGVVFFEMLSGHKPYQAPTAAAMSYAHVNSPIPLLEPAYAHFQGIINRVLAKKPQDRFDSVMDFAKEIEMADISMAPTIIAKRNSTTFTPQSGEVATESSLVNKNDSPVTQIDTNSEAQQKNQRRMLIAVGVVSVLAVISGISSFVLAPKKIPTTIINVIDKENIPEIRPETVPEPNNPIDTPVRPIVDNPDSKPESVPDPKPDVLIANVDPPPSIPDKIIKPTIDPVDTPSSNDGELTTEQTIIVESLLDSSLLRSAMVVKEMIRINKNEDIIEAYKGLKMDSGRTKFITDTRRQIESSKQTIKTNINLYFINLTKLKSYKVSSVNELIDNKEDDQLKVLNQGIMDLLYKHIKTLADNNLTLLECEEDFSSYAKIIASTI